MTAPPQGVVGDHAEFLAGKVRYYRAGETGPAVVLLHGGGIDNALLSWRHTIPTLAVDHRVFVPDLPGHGGSLQWQGKAAQRTLEEVLRWLLDVWGLDEVTLVGLSTGGSVATGFTLRHPQRVRGLVLVGSGGLQYRLPRHLLTYLFSRARFAGSLPARLMSTTRFSARGYLRGVLHDPLQVTDLEPLIAEVRQEARDCRSVHSDWLSDAITRRGMKVNHLPHLDRIRCPLMVVHGDSDTEVPVSVAREAAGAVRGSKLRVLSGVGHWCHREKPTEFNAALREFVNGLGS